MNKLTSIGQMEWLRNKTQAALSQARNVIHVCMTGCRAYGAAEVLQSLQDEVKRQGMEKEVEVRSTGCHGFCARAPVIALDPLGVQYQEVGPEDAAEIIGLTIKQNRLIDRLAYKEPKTNKPIYYRDQIPFYKKQERRVLALCGRIDPTSIEHYIAAGGYQALVRVLSGMAPEQVAQEVIDAKLRGRGGAGFPAGLKWKFARQSSANPKYIICNADEGDPGAFMDRAILEGDPHSVIEGMIIGAYAMGARFGFIYVREEYPIAVEHLNCAIAQAGELGLLGENILGTGFSFDLSLKMGAGAFVCGEETALMASIEGKRGMPRARPPFPAQSGVDGKPSNINNVETFANVPLILKNGAGWYAQVGTENSKGTKIFSLAGKVNNTGLVEVPIGTSIREVVFDIGGGIPKGRKFKAVQMGGPSGGCVPAQFLNLSIDYDTLQKIGAIMGSGGMVVMDENNCMVEIARFFLAFTQSESCGKCSPCRLGTTQLLEILTRITAGRGRLEDIETIKEIGRTMTEASLCGLGQNCAKPAISTLQYFLKEYEDHILENRCAGAVCKSMVISACQHACPAGIDVPNYVAAIARGRFQDAVDIIRERNPFPAVCGRICIHPCEFKCRRGELDEPVAIRLLKRFATDWYFDNMGVEAEPFPVTRKEKVAVVGAGPAGLTCAYFLAEMGYKTTVFEAASKGGGMLGITVPEFRLPRHVIEQEIQYIRNKGVEIQYDSPIDANHTVNDLMASGYKAVFIAAGAQASKTIGIPGEEEGLEGLFYGLQFLTQVKGENPVSLSGRAVVIGGGNVAIDVARTALRVGASDVQVFCLESFDQMPAWDKEVDEAMEEGIVINPSWSPRLIVSEEGKVQGVEFSRCDSVFDEDGKFNPTCDDSTIRMVEAENVIISIGQAADMSFLSQDEQLERALWGTLAVDENRLATNIPGIFAGGDFTTGPTFVIRAISSGRRAAIAIDKYLSGDSGRVHTPDRKTRLIQDAGLALEDEEGGKEAPRVKVALEDTQERAHDFREIEKGFTKEQALREAVRCLRCDLEREEEAS
ncbi:NADH-quinone oxidoreductase subunit F [Desulfatibacillum alkenivorans DSM 16219]|jgi:NADH-quinone oxidoreductase subunit F|uniref:NADH-quinone oxidoreductase subunit F n=1 Tax=Desulfatibacillum alkenivorans DSM 16219 TaxID=1121393 RepID=A0A1M6LEP7_9BACT|nr:FAD-dependent oxidoreductase [Desulfatibacillum alkenivorans]SHJ69618.1 NADH-quinone oxidoreductase subunit F [Desulfatibacillum alkenivorans DSM 16219]